MSFERVGSLVQLEVLLKLWLKQWDQVTFQEARTKIKNLRKKVAMCFDSDQLDGQDGITSNQEQIQKILYDEECYWCQRSQIALALER